jgi:hypothetical protein
MDKNTSVDTSYLDPASIQGNVLGEHGSTGSTLWSSVTAATLIGLPTRTDTLMLSLELSAGGATPAFLSTPAADSVHVVKSPPTVA